jgi:DNA-binding response OmpR family regulator
MHDAAADPLIAVMDSSRDLVSILQSALDEDGFRTVGRVATRDEDATVPLAFLRDHQPAAVVYNVSPLDPASWTCLTDLRRQWQRGHFLLTTTNLGALRAHVGPSDPSALLGKPFDLSALTTSLRRVLAA